MALHQGLYICLEVLRVTKAQVNEEIVRHIARFGRLTALSPLLIALVTKSTSKGTVTFGQNGLVI